MIARLTRALRRLRRDTDGSQAMSFMLSVPLLMGCTAFAFDAGLLLVRTSLLERAVDVEMRAVRLGHSSHSDYEGLRKAICSRAKILPECETRLKLQLKAMRPYVWEDPGALPDCESLKQVTVTAPREFDSAGSNQLVVLRACIVLEPLLPRFSIGESLLSANDGSKNRFYQVSATSTFVMEPSGV